jgi:predicted MFS family arabinose efflux permease
VLGAAFSQYFTDGYGRRYTFIVAAIGFLIGILIMSFSNTYGLLMFGRFFVGVGVGIGLAVRYL